MKRSEINRFVGEAEAVFARHQFALPPFAGWSAVDFKQRRREEIAEILDCELGWDVTDFGSGRYLECGLLLVTLRNGKSGSSIYRKPYAEKIMISREGQVTPLHCHRYKTEDIINRAGGVLVFELYKSDSTGGLDPGVVTFLSDGCRVTIPAGEPFLVSPGQSISLEPGVFHSFYAQKGSGQVMAGEVSAVNDDHADNVFYEKLPRYPAIEEDAPIERLLVSDYASLADIIS